MFNSGVFSKTLRRFWPVWALYFVCWFAAVPAEIINRMDLHMMSAGERIIDSVQVTAVWLCPLAACAAAMAAFSHLYNERSANFYAALPAKRGAMYAASAAAGLLPLLAVNVLIFLISLVLTAVGSASASAALWQWLGAVSLEILAYFGIAVFCAMLTGHILMLPLLFIGINILAMVLGNMAASVPEHFTYGYIRTGRSVVDAFSPLVGILDNVGSTYSSSSIMGNASPVLTGWGYLLAYGAAGAALLAVSALLYRRRSTESAGDVVAIAPLRPVFKYIVTVTAALVLGGGLYFLFFYAPAGTGGAGAKDAAIYSLCMAVGAFAGCFVSEMLLQKSFAVFGGGVKKYLGWIIVSVLCAAYVFGCSADVTGFETRVPEPESVEFVDVTINGQHAVFWDEEDVRAVTELHRHIVENKERNIEADMTRPCIWVNLGYHMDGVSIMRRQYLVDESDAEAMAAAGEIMNRPETILERKDARYAVSPADISQAQIVFATEPPAEDGGTRPAEIVELTGEEAAELYNECIYPDMKDAAIGLVWYGGASDEYRESVYNCTIYLYFKESSNNLSMFHTYPTVFSERTNAWLTEHGVTLRTLAETGANDPVG